MTQCSPLIGPEFLPREEFLRERSQQHEDIVWLRPHEISRPDEPILVSNKNEGFDVKQVTSHKHTVLLYACKQKPHWVLYI